MRGIPRLRLRMRTRKGDGFGTEVSVVTKPELGVRVRVQHSIITGKGQYAFDYELEPARQVARDILNAVDYARELEAEIAGEAKPAPAMAIPGKRRRRR